MHELDTKWSGLGTFNSLFIFIPSGIISIIIIITSAEYSKLDALVGIVPQWLTLNLPKCLPYYCWNTYLNYSNYDFNKPTTVELLIILVEHWFTSCFTS